MIVREDEPRYSAVNTATVVLWRGVEIGIVLELLEVAHALQENRGIEQL
jgi:hypothetical protein